MKPDQERPTIEDKLGVMAHKMTDAELRECIEAVCSGPKTATPGTGESLVLLALMAEEARRVRA